MASAAEIEALGVAKEVAANKRRKDAGLTGSASDYEYASNLRSIAAGFTDAADQEIDANRRAREAGFLNAAVKENPAAAAPGTSIYSTDPFVDPRNAVKLPDQWYYEAAEKTPGSYVDSSSDLAAAWAKIQSDPTGTQGAYWLPRMGGVSTKEAFGKAHAKEDMALKMGTYQGDTKYTKGSDAWKGLFTTQAGQFGGPESYPTDKQSTSESPLTRWEMFTPTTRKPAGGPTGGPTGDSGPDWTDPNSTIYTGNNQQTMDLAVLTDEMMLSNKLTEIINMNSPLFKAASTKALQQMQKKGIVNSSLAQEAVMGAILDVAMPIAQAEVEALQQNLYYNNNWTNEQKTAANKYFYDRMLVKLDGSLNLQLQKMSNTFSAWGKYGDWIAQLGTAQGADLDAWRRMLDALRGAGGWPNYPG